jgi:DNA gyrase/topoisomerase IV subunit A
MTSKFGQVINMSLKDIPHMGRSTQGVILMRFADKTDHIAAVTAVTGTPDMVEEAPKA